MEIDTGNAAFEDNPVSNTAHIARQIHVALTIIEFEGTKKIFDINGNTVGRIWIAGEYDEAD